MNLEGCLLALVSPMSSTSYSDENSGIELLGYKSLNHLLNTYLGPKWPLQMKLIFSTTRKEGLGSRGLIPTDLAINTGFLKI